MGISGARGKNCQWSMNDRLTMFITNGALEGRELTVGEVEGQ